MNNEQDNKLKRMKMHENNEGNAMLTRKGKKRENGIKLQQGGVQAVTRGCAENKMRKK